MGQAEKVELLPEEETSFPEHESKESNKQQRRFWQKPVFIVIGIAIFLSVSGAVVGYSVLGDGKPLDALKFSTWKHIYDLVYKDVETTEY